MMPSQQFDHILSLKITSEMRDDIDNALLGLKAVISQNRSEFLRRAASFALASLAEDSHGRDHGSAIKFGSSDCADVEDVGQALDPDHTALLERPVDPNTRVDSVTFFRAAVPFLMEHWSSDGISGIAAVFLTEDVADMDDAAMRLILTDAGVPVVGDTTLSRRPAHTFFNFGFDGI